MAAVCLFETSSPSAADDIVDAVNAGDLWGFTDFGSTSKAVSYSNYALVELTHNRSMDLTDVVPEGTLLCLWNAEAESFTDSPVSAKAMFLRGMLEE